MVYHFMVNSISGNVRNNIGFMVKTVEVTNLDIEVKLMQDCIKQFLAQTPEEIEEQVKVLLGKISTFTAPMDNKVSYRALSDYIASLMFFGYEVLLVKRVDLNEDFPLDDGVAICYLLDETTSVVSNIVEGIGKEFDDINEPVNTVDSVMVWLTSGAVAFNNDIEQIAFLESKKAQYANMKARKMSLDFDASPIYEVLRCLRQKPVLVTNIAPDEFEDINNAENV